MALLGARPLTDLGDQLAAVLNHGHNGLLQLRGHGHVGRPLQAEEHHRERLVGEVGLLQVLQVWSLTQFYSVDISQSRIGVKKCVFNKRTIKVCVRCC